MTFAGGTVWVLLQYPRRRDTGRQDTGEVR